MRDRPVTPWTVGKTYREMVPDLVPRNKHRDYAEALFKLSQTQRQLAHRARQEAAKAEAEGNLRWYCYWQCEVHRLWKSAFFHLRWARDHFYG